MDGWTVVTHDWRSPLPGGEPRCALVPGPDACGAGWNFYRTPAGALRIGGLWPDGWPCRLIYVEASDAGGIVESVDTWRAASLTLAREATSAELQAAMLDLCASVGPPHQAALGAEQWKWYQALGRPHHDADMLTAHLQRALSTRGLDWDLHEFTSVGALKAAVDAWTARSVIDAWAARVAFDSWDATAVKAARVAFDSWIARVWNGTAWDGWAAFDSWTPRTVWDGWTAIAAWAARAALVVYISSTLGLISTPKDLFSTGLREAYAHGLAIAFPVGLRTLGWAMDAQS